MGFKGVYFSWICFPDGTKGLICFQDQGELSIWFLFQKTKYLYDGVEKKTFVQVEFPISESIQTYLDWKGYQLDEEIQHAENQFGKNM